MRILQVRFKNLNSLIGAWEINLAHPAFISDGIFAITGPTGAGKTTVLDAICLALYGRTPRLSKITKNGNELMSRHTGECFAEVIFETQEGRFNCHWSQRRARKAAGGELQSPKHEISNADSGEILTSRIRGVAEEIEKATGMDFDRFTRSMLLAQGGFAAFLQAAPDERAPILEQITGTEIYSKISIRVHELCFDEREKLKTLQAELGGLQQLTTEEKLQLTESLSQKEQQDTELTKQLTQKNIAITWLEGMDRLEKELQALDLHKSAWLTGFESFKPEQERLRLANQALELSADYSELTAIRKAQEADRGSLGESQVSLPQRADAVTLAEVALKTASEQLEARKSEQRAAQPIIRKVRELDLKIIEKSTPINSVRVYVKEHSSSLHALTAKQKIDLETSVNQRKSLEELQALLAASLSDEHLVGHLAGLRNSFDALKLLSGQFKDKLEEKSQAESGYLGVLEDLQEQTNCLNKEQRAMQEIEKTLAEKQAEFLNTLDGKDAATWRKDQSLLTEQKYLVSNTLETVKEMEKAEQAGIRLNSRQVALKQEEYTRSATLATLIEQQATLEKEMGLLETQLVLIKRIEALEEARGRLQDGQPCPLCGAEDHPYAKGNIPTPGEAEPALAVVRKKLKALAGESSDLKVKLAQVKKDLEQTDKENKENIEKIAEANRVIRANCTKLRSDRQLTANDPELHAKLDRLQDENSSRLIHVTGILEAADVLEKQLAKFRGLQEKARDSVAKLERAAQNAAHKKESAEQLLERLKKEAAADQGQQEKSFDTLRKEIEPYAITALSVENIDKIYKQLEARRDQYLSRNKKKTELERKIAALEIQTVHQDEQIRETDDDIRKQQKLLNELLLEQDTLKRERQELFGTKKTDDEEARLSTAIESADKNLDNSRQKLSEVNQALNRLKSKIDELEKALHSRDLRLNSVEESFRARLKAAAFADENNYNSACLHESERKMLAEQERKLSDERTEIDSRERAIKRKLEEERIKALTEEPLVDLKNAVDMLTQTQRDIQQETGVIRQKLADNASLGIQHQKLLEAINAQKQECARWNLLHELIGSADGKKYRNFAQGLTLAVMVKHANKQLKKMTDRYVLVCAADQALELNVIDSYQAGEIRSTKNLSGGESFIVSLSLALGLSQMSSRNVRVDSLFLDEGFGTLDDEALDTALETLANLQQDGKLIGVISHVPAIRERISTQIQVVPQTEGRSHIIGPGCNRLGAQAKGA